VTPGRFARALAGTTEDIPPVWCMRQAGRYQQSYQALRQHHTFEDLCRDPDLSAQVAGNAVAEFDFDAAILFSDLLFHLDAIGLGVRYDDGGPRLSRRLDEEMLPGLPSVDEAASRLEFQARAVAATRRALPTSRGLIGFVGGPWTLFVYAIEGTHAGSLMRAKASLPLYRRFAELMVPLLARTARAQLDAGADVVMVLDTAAGEVSPDVFRRDLAPDLKALAEALPGRLGYYARASHPAHFGDQADGLGPWGGVGFDWRWQLADVLADPARRGFVQGNFDPALLAQLSGEDLRDAIVRFLEPIAALPSDARRGWICGLGHGVLPTTPEANVRQFVDVVREHMA
jgi:uroporphyrinogen decarboxylase